MLALQACASLKLFPRYSLHPNGNNDPNGLHASCPVRVGEKWSANYWVWNKACRWPFPLRRTPPQNTFDPMVCC